MSTAYDHDTSCDAPCSRCASDWTCPYMGIACRIPHSEHLCPKCDPEAKCRECGAHDGHLYGCRGAKP